MRLFLAIPMPTQVAVALARVQDEIPIGRPVPEENLHLTLAFLGEIPVTRAEAVHEVLEGVSAAPVELTFGALAVIEPAQPRALVLDVVPSRRLVALQGSVVSAARRAGLDLPRRRFRPHVTLVRFAGRLTPPDELRLAAVLARLGLPRLWPVTAQSITLFQSHLRRDGALYEELAVYPLT